MTDKSQDRIDIQVNTHGHIQINIEPVCNSLGKSIDNLMATGMKTKDTSEKHDSTGFGRTWMGILAESQVLDLLYMNRGLKLETVNSGGTEGLGLPGGQCK